MIVDIIIVAALLVLAASHIILLTKPKEEDHSDELWLSTNVAIKDLEKHLITIDQTINARMGALDSRLDIQNRVTGDIGKQVIYVEEELMKSLEEYSSTLVNRVDLFEQHLVNELSKANENHAASLKKLSEETWSAFLSTDKRIKEADSARKDLKRSLDRFETKYGKQTLKFQTLIDANVDAFKKANKEFTGRFKELTSLMESSRKTIEKDLQKTNSQVEKVGNKLATSSGSLNEKLLSSNQKSKKLIAETKQSLQKSISDNRTRLEKKTAQDLEKVDSHLEKMADKFSKDAESLNEKLLSSNQKSKKLIAETKQSLQKSISDNRTRLEKKTAQDLEKVDSHLEKMADKFSKDAEKINSRLDKEAARIDQELMDLLKNDKGLQSDQEQSGDRINTIQTDLVSIKENEDSFMRHVQRQNQITKNIENLVNRSNTFNYNTFHVFDRRFVRKDYEETLKPMLELFGLSMSFNTMGYLAHKICKIEEDCVGRLATNIQDALIRLISVFGLKRKQCRILEIGTLFGINLCIVEELSAAYGKELKYQVIDPLDGYYKHGQLDIVTKQEVNSRNFWYNINKCGLDAEKFELIKGFSHHKRIVRQVKKRSVDLIFVDGDHTRKGVALDIRNYADTLKKGGLFMFDDYGSRQWPEVKEAVDASRIIKSQFTFIGHAFRTAIYAKK